MYCYQSQGKTPSTTKCPLCLTVCCRTFLGARQRFKAPLASVNVLQLNEIMKMNNEQQNPQKRYFAISIVIYEKKRYPPPCVTIKQFIQYPQKKKKKEKKNVPVKES
jgi:hypothetical protein